MSKGPDNVTQTTTSEPPAYLLPYLRQATGSASSLFQQGPQQFYPGNTVVPFSQQTNQALNLQQNRALSGSPVIDAAQQATQDIALGNTPLSMLMNPQMGPTGASTLSPLTSTGTIGGPGGDNLAATARGDFLNNNPFLDATFDRAASAVNRNLDTILARSGRDLTGNFGERERELSDLASSIYGGNFQAERGRQLQASGQLSGQGSQALSQLAGQQFAGGQSALERQLSAARGVTDQQLSAASQAIPLAREDYFDIAQLGGVGGTVEQQAQNIINDRLGRFNFAQQAPANALNQFISQISGTPAGQTTTSSQPLYNNTGSTLGSLAGLGLFGGPFGMLAGGLLGGLFD